MRKPFFALLACLLTASTASAASQANVMQPIRQFIDSFNAGDSKTAFAAWAKGDITIIDEFPPYRWVGPQAPRVWAADDDKFDRATGVTEPSVKYGEPSRSEIEGDAAYVIVPAVYIYKQHGVAMAEEGQITFVLRAEEPGWKIASWTWSGVKPHPAR